MYYGAPITAPTQLARLRCAGARPVRRLDRGIPVDSVRAMERSLLSAGKTGHHQVYAVPITPSRIRRGRRTTLPSPTMRGTGPSPSSAPTFADRSAAGTGGSDRHVARRPSRSPRCAVRRHGLVGAARTADAGRGHRQRRLQLLAATAPASGPASTPRACGSTCSGRRQHGSRRACWAGHQRVRGGSATRDCTSGLAGLAQAIFTPTLELRRRT